MSDRESGPSGVEHELRHLVPTAMPPGLRSRVLVRASETRRGAVLRPWMRVAAGAVSVLVLGMIVLDPVLGRRDEARMAAVLDGRVTAPSNAEDAAVLAETMYGVAGAEEAARIVRLETLAAAASRQERECQAIAAREWLKGWLKNEEGAEDPE